MIDRTTGDRTSLIEAAGLRELPPSENDGVCFCALCGSRTKVKDSRVSHGGKYIRRSRRCVKCKVRYTTMECREIDIPEAMNNKVADLLISIAGDILARAKKYQ